MAATKTTILALAGTALASWGAWDPSSTSALATVTPCPWASKDYPIHPITVTSQHQTVSTCSPVSKCIKGSCITKADCTPYQFVSTTIPCGFDSTSSSSTCVTSTDQLVTVSNWESTVTNWDPVPSSHPTPVYTTFAKEFRVPYNKLGSFVLPGYAGSGLCEECSADADGKSTQEVDVIACKSSPEGPQCVEYAEKWISTHGPSTTAEATGFCSSHASVPSAGTYTYTFAFTEPAPAAPSGSDWSYDPKMWLAEIVKECDGPEEFVIIETVTEVLIFTVPWHTASATTSHSLPYPTGSHAWSFPEAATQSQSDPRYIQVFDSGAKYHSGAKYIGFSDDDGILVGDKSLAALFYFGEDGSLMCDGKYVGAELMSGYQVFEKYDHRPAVHDGWSLDPNKGLSWSFGNGEASFCMTGDNSLIVSFGSMPSFSCKPVDLSCGNAPPNKASPTKTAGPTSTSSQQADPSSDLDDPVDEG